MAEFDQAALDEFNNNLYEINESIKDQTELLGDMVASLKGTTAEVDKNGKVIKKATETQEQYNERMGKFLREKSIENLGTAFQSLTKTVLSSEAGFSKYNATLDAGGKALADFSASFGGLGKALSLVIKGATFAAKQWTAQADNLLKASDSISKLGAANSFSTKQILEMGHNAGLMSYELDKLIKPMQSVQGGFIGMAGTQAEGVKRFGEMTSVLKQTRLEFQRLGLNDQERIQAQADFITMMNKSGAAFNGNLRTQQGLQKASLDYTKNLLELAAITGTDLETAKKQREIQMATMEVALQNNKWAQDRIKAEKSGDAEAVARIDKERAGFEQFNNELKQAGLSQEQIVAAQNQYLTGAITSQSAQFAVMGVNLDSYIRKAKANELEKGELAEKVKERVNVTLQGIGQRTFGLSEDLRKSFGINLELVSKSTQLASVDLRSAAGQAAAAIEENAAGRGAVAEDPAQIARGKLTEAERSAKEVVDDIVAASNPLLNGMNALTTAAVIAAGALAAMAASSAMGGMFGGKGGFKMPAGGIGKIPVGGAMKFLGKGLLKGGVAGAVGGLAGGALESYAEGHEGTGAGQAAHTLGTAASWGATGAMVGSVIPGVGTLLGGLVGATAGAIKAGFFDTKKEIAKTSAESKDKTPEERLAEMQEKESESTKNTQVNIFADRLAAANKNLSALTISFTKFNEQFIVASGEDLGTQVEGLSDEVRNFSDLAARLRGGGGGGVSGASPVPFKGSNKEFYDKMYSTLFEEAKKAGLDNPDAIAKLGATQSALETGYGKHLAGGGNYFGIKGSSGRGVSTQEWDPVQGKMVTIKDQFRQYSTMGESAADYIKFLQQNKRYQGVLSSQDALSAISAQGRTGYATDPNYSAKLASIYQTYGANLTAPSTEALTAANGDTKAAERTRETATRTEDLVRVATTSNADAITALGAKLDNIRSLLETSNDIQNKIKQNTA